MSDLVAGVDSSTQSCKVVIRDAATGAVVRQGRHPHLEGTEVDPEVWWRALGAAIAEAGGLDDVSALSVAGQQHGMVCLDEEGRVVRPALLWNVTRSAEAAAELTEEIGAAAWAQAVGSVPLAAFTVAKLRWFAEHEPDLAARVAAVCLPHDWLTWRLSGSMSLDDIVTDRSDASGTGYFDPRSNVYRLDLLRMAFGRDLVVPRVLGPRDPSGSHAGVLLAPGGGDNAAAHLGLMDPDATVVSLGTSGTVFARSSTPTLDDSALVAGFADMTGAYLPLVCTLNAARVLDAVSRLLGVGLDRLSELALSAPPRAHGVTLVPYFEGERTPNLPCATGSLHGLTLATASPANVARAAVEGMLSGLADGVHALARCGVPTQRVVLIGGAAQSAAVRRIAPSVFGVPVAAPAPDEYVAAGAARQAAWVLSGDAEAPRWRVEGSQRYAAPLTEGLAERYHRAAERYLER